MLADVAVKSATKSAAPDLFANFMFFFLCYVFDAYDTQRARLSVAKKACVELGGRRCADDLKQGRHA